MIYVDTDTLFLGPADELWDIFSQFNSSHMSALALENDNPNVSWYTRFAKHPFYGKYGERFLLYQILKLISKTIIRRTLLFLFLYLFISFHTYLIRFNPFAVLKKNLSTLTQVFYSCKLACSQIS